MGVIWELGLTGLPVSKAFCTHSVEDCLQAHKKPFSLELCCRHKVRAGRVGNFGGFSSACRVASYCAPIWKLHVWLVQASPSTSFLCGEPQLPSL